MTPALRETSQRPAAIAARVPPQLKVERVKAAPDTDGATRQTVEKMCEYIRASAADPRIVAAADYAWRHFGMGVDRAAMKAWAVFWYVKHCVKFRQDEATMFRVGEENQQDLLISPAVLARMKDPAEDCDGFTMLECAMLSALGIPVVIATVAADPDDPQRWSHVFPCALLPAGTTPIFAGIAVRGGVLPLDASHGVGPGWMVPRDRIFRWQAWDLDARPTDVAPMKFQGLHGYVRSGRAGMGATRGGYRRVGMRGLGQDEGGFDSGATWIPDPNNIPTISMPSSSGPLSFPQMIGAGGGGGTNWTSLLNNLIGTAGRVATVAELPAGSTVYPSGAVSSGYGTTLGGSLSFSSLIVPLGIGLALLLLLSKGKG